MTGYQRQLAIDATRARDEDRTAPAVLSTEYPVQRGNFAEILSHEPGAVDLSRQPLPLIESHDTNRLNIGVVEKLRLEGRKLRGVVRLGASARAVEIWEDIKAGIVNSLSIGYEWKAFDDQGERVFVTKWAPYEASLVAAPADPNAGLFRSQNFRGNETMKPEEHDNIEAENKSMTRSQRRAENRSAEIERERIEEIRALSEAHGLDREMMQRAIDNGTSIETFQRAALERIGQRDREARTFIDLPGGVGGANGEYHQYSLVRALNVFTAPKGYREAEYPESVTTQTRVFTGGQTRHL